MSVCVPVPAWALDKAFAMTSSVLLDADEKGLGPSIRSIFECEIPLDAALVGKNFAESP